MKVIDLSGERILVIGGAGAIGAAICDDLALAGAEVVVADVDPHAAAGVVEGILDRGGRAEAVVIDVRSTKSVSDGFAALTSERAITGLVNAAGVLRTGPLAETTDEMWEQMSEVNISGVLRTVREASAHFSANRRGVIVNVASVSAYIGSSDGAAYTTTKGAVVSLTYGMAGELAPAGVRVNAVCPAWVDGGFTHQALAGSADPAALRESARRLHPLGRMATPQDVASAVTWLVSPEAAFVTGITLFVDGGFMIHHGS